MIIFQRVKMKLSKCFLDASAQADSQVQSLGIEHFPEKKTRKALSPFRLEQRPREKMNDENSPVAGGLKALQRYLLIKS